MRIVNVSVECLCDVAWPFPRPRRTHPCWRRAI